MSIPLKPPQPSSCPINMALEILGDLWSPLIARDLMFTGRRQFGNLLSANEKIATNIPSSRLASLARDGMIESLPDANDRLRTHYALTEKGIDLAPMVSEPIAWSARHYDTAAPPPVVEAIQHHRADWLAAMRAVWTKSRGGGLKVQAAFLSTSIRALIASTILSRIMVSPWVTRRWSAARRMISASS
jgi:DNA-binding HxlR family transcriptional regulator